MMCGRTLLSPAEVPAGESNRTKHECASSPRHQNQTQRNRTTTAVRGVRFYGVGRNASAQSRQAIVPLLSDRFDCTDCCSYRAPGNTQDNTPPSAEIPSCFSRQRGGRNSRAMRLSKYLGEGSPKPPFLLCVPPPSFE